MSLSGEQAAGRGRRFRGALGDAVSRVALLLPNTPFYVVSYYAVLMAGGTVVNCNPLYTVHELTHIASNAGASRHLACGGRGSFFPLADTRWATSSLACRMASTHAVAGTAGEEGGCDQAGEDSDEEP